MTTVRKAAMVAISLAGTVLLAGCGDGSTPATPAPVPAPPAAPTPPAPEPTIRCGVRSLRVDFLGPGGAAGIARGELTLDADDPEVGLDFAAPYTIQVPAGGANLDVPGLRPTVGVFVSDLGFSPLGEGFRQSMTVAWLSVLEVHAGLPGCDPVIVSCDLRGCTGS